jgi:hypothetical protein
MGKHLIPILAFLFLWVINADAQYSTNEVKASSHAQQAYAEILGAGGLYSFNYDQRFGKNEKGFGFRAGFSVLGGMITDDFDESFGAVLFFPVGPNFLAGGRGHYFEAGGGATPALATGGGGGIFGYGQLGYRFQPFQKRGFTFRANITGLAGEGSGLIWVGLSGGYRW